MEQVVLKELFTITTGYYANIYCIVGFGGSEYFKHGI